MNQIFKKGERVQFVAIYIGNDRISPDKQGLVAANSNQTADRVAVRWDGRKSSSYHQKKFIEIVRTENGKPTRESPT